MNNRKNRRRIYLLVVDLGKSLNCLKHFFRFDFSVLIIIFVKTMNYGNKEVF